jgi:hypothetical protein
MHTPSHPPRADVFLPSPLFPVALSLILHFLVHQPANPTLLAMSWQVLKYKICTATDRPERDPAR